MDSYLCTYPCNEALPNGGRKHVLGVKCNVMTGSVALQPAVLGDMPVGEDQI